MAVAGIVDSQYGTAWKSSEDCWKSKADVSNDDSITAEVNEIQDGMMHAHVVDEEALHRNILQRLGIYESIPITPRKTQIIVVVSVLLLLLIGIFVTVSKRLAFWEDGNNDSYVPTPSPTAAYVPTMDKIRHRGHINCVVDRRIPAAFHMDFISRRSKMVQLL